MNNHLINYIAMFGVLWHAKIAFQFYKFAHDKIYVMYICFPSVFFHELKIIWFVSSKTFLLYRDLWSFHFLRFECIRKSHRILKELLQEIKLQSSIKRLPNIVLGYFETDKCHFKLTKTRSFYSETSLFCPKKYFKSLGW